MRNRFRVSFFPNPNNIQVSYNQKSYTDSGEHLVINHSNLFKSFIHAKMFFLPNKTDRHYITEILLKVAFNNFNPNPYQSNCLIHFFKLKIEIILIVQFYNKPQEVVQTKTFLHE
jgi:hypothetical protein